MEHRPTPRPRRQARTEFSGGKARGAKSFERRSLFSRAAIARCRAKYAICRIQAPCWPWVTRCSVRERRSAVGGEASTDCSARFQSAQLLRGPYERAGGSSSYDRARRQGTEQTRVGTLIIGPEISFVGEITACKRLVVDGLVEATLSQCQRWSSARVVS